MAYEQVKIVVAGVSGEIYMARALKNGLMSDSRRIATDECQAAVAEWFMTNNKKMLQYAKQRSGATPTLFYTGDAEKAKRILEILGEE